MDERLYYHHISCLPLIRKLLRGIISEYLLRFLEESKLIPEERRACKRNSRGTKYQVFLNKAVLRDCKRRISNLAMAWIVYQKLYDMTPHN